MSTLYALLVGVNRYLSPSVPDLAGCVQDVDDALEMLRTRTAAGTKLDARALRDGEATRAAVVDGLRTHLGQAGPGDTALFWFSGHGGQARVPLRWWYEEPTGMLQTLLCADSRHGDVHDLLDKELSALLDGIARRGCHLAVVVDSCHSGGVTRELVETEPAVRSRAVEALTKLPPREALVPELLEHGGPPAPDHVLLAASRSGQAAQELPLGGRTRGVFSWALLRALARLPAAPTYRDLLIAAQTEVEQIALRQVPRLLPLTPGIADQPFLGGEVRRPDSGLLLRYAGSGWEINAGRCHGLPADTGPLRVAWPGDGPAREAEVVQVLPDRSLVTPLHWQPDPDRQYRVVLTDVPLPATTVAIGGPDQDPATAGHVVAAIGAAGPTGGPSPHLRVVDPDDDTRFSSLRAVIPRPGVVRLFDHHREPIGGEIDGVSDVAGAAPVVEALEHVARWRTILELDNPVSQLAGAVAVEIVAAQPGEAVAPLDRAPAAAADDGAVHFHYRYEAGQWRSPNIFIRLHNTGDRPLFCVLLDLTGAFRVHAKLFSGDFVAPGHHGAALRGAPIPASLPAGTDPRPGRSVRDWLKLIVAEREFSCEPFEMPALGQRRWTSRRPLAVRGLLERLAYRAQVRDLGPDAGDEVYDWTAVTVPIVTEVPDATP